MGWTTHDYLIPYSEITTPLPYYQENYTLLENIIQEIQVNAGLQDFDITGIRDDKQQARIVLALLASDTARKLHTFAKFTNNGVLLKEVKISETALKRLADADLKTKAQGIHDRAHKNLAVLAQYGINAASQTALLNAINAFNASITRPRLGIAGKNQSKKLVSSLFDKMDEALNNIDAAIEIVKLTEPIFYSGYRAARRVINSGSGSLALKGVISDAASGEGLMGATVSLSLKGGSTVVTKRTADKGGFNVRTLNEDVYTLTVSKNGYKEVTMDVHVTHGELCVLDIALEKVK